MAIVKTSSQVLLLILLVMLASACQDAVTGLTSSELWKSFLNMLSNSPAKYGWIIIIALQFLAMKWLGGVWNVIFSIMSFLLLAELATAGGSWQVCPRG